MPLRLAAFDRTRRASRSAGDRSDQADRWVRVLLQQRLSREALGRRVGRTSDGEEDGLVDIRVAGPGDPKGVDDVFGRLRWGGVFACVDPNPERLGKLLTQYDGANGFVIEQGFDELWAGPRGLRIPGVTPRAYFFVARKVQLVRPGKVSQRFTFDVSLEPSAAEPLGYCVRKRVPETEALVKRLLRRDPDAEPPDVRAHATRLVQEVLPIFLTREAKVLTSLQQSLPEALRARVPRLLEVHRNAQGLVTELKMSWLRNGGPGISQLQFARQATELLDALHRESRVMHLDLRPDNLVITPAGVGFVDFGSSAMIGEELETNRVLGPLYADMMRTSQIQRALGQMLADGRVTNEALASVHGKADPRVDLFYLAVQINQPQSNPELRELIDVNPMSDDARQLELLTAAVLRPKAPDRQAGKTVGDLLRGIARIERKTASAA